MKQFLDKDFLLSTDMAKQSIMITQKICRS